MTDFGPPPAPSPRRAPTPSPAPSPSLAPNPARYAYLVGRLRSRQITMEEATELFALQQAMVTRAQAEAARIARAPVTPARPAGLPPPPPASTGALGEDLWWMGVLALGAGAGLLAALLRRAREAPNEPARDRDRAGSSTNEPAPP